MNGNTAQPQADTSKHDACYRTVNHHVYALIVVADDDPLHEISTAQPLETVIHSNHDRWEDPAVPPDQAVLRFGDTEVVALGGPAVSRLP